jgi:hypothetical protein
MDQMPSACQLSSLHKVQIASQFPPVKIQCAIYPNAVDLPQPPAKTMRAKNLRVLSGRSIWNCFS